MTNNNQNMPNVPNLRFPEFEGDWKLRKLNDLADKVNSGKTPLGGEAVYSSHGIPFIRSQNVTNDQLQLENPVFIPEPVNAQMKNSVVKADDILLNITGASLGRSCVVPKEFEMGNVNQHVCIIRLNNQADPRFVQPVFSSEKGQSIFNSLQTGSGREGLNFESIKGIKLYIPEYIEQKKIASFLALLNSRIQTQSKIIEELKALKATLCKKIFTRQINFKGNNKDSVYDWKNTLLGDIAAFYRGSSLSKADILESGKSKCIHYGELFTIYEEVISNIVSKTNNDGFSSKIGDILMPSSDVTPIGLATASVILEDGVILGGDINIVRPIEKNNPIFLSYILNYEKKKIIDLVSGTTVKHIYNKDLKKIQLNLPSSIEEQIRISNILSIIDKKRTLEVNLMQKMKTQKQFLLQNLFI